MQERSLLRMGEERRVEVREKIFEFPQQFAALRPQLADFVTQVFAENPYQETPLLRGVYFTSGTQEGRPIDRVMQKMAEGFGIRPRMAAGAPPTEAKSYFLREVFSRIVFPDGGLAVRSSKSLRRERFIRWGVTGAAIAGAAGIALLPASAYNANRQLNQEVRALVDALVDSTATKGEPAASSALAAVAPTARKLLEYQTAGPPVAMRYGMYQGNKLLDTVTIATRDYLVVPVLKADARGVAVASRGAKIGGAEVAHLLDALQLHLLLTAPKTEDEPKPEDRAWDKDWSRWIRDHLVAHWSDRAKADKDGSSAKTLQALAEFYARRLIDDPDLLPERDDVTVVTARRLINSAGHEDPVTRVVSDPELKQFDLSLTAMLGGAATSFTSDPVVRGGFTRAAWDAGIKDRLETDEDQGTSWVTRKQGSSTELPPEEKQRRVAEYLRRYVDEWTKFLIAVQPKVPSDLPEAQTLISRLTGDRAFESLWHAVNENVRLDNGTVDEAAAVVEKKLLDPIKRKFKLGAKGQKAANAKLAGLRGKLSGPDEVEKHFDTFLKFGPSEQPGVKSALESYLDQLRTVGIAIKVYLETQEAKPFRSAVQGAKFEIEDLISRYRDNGWDSVLRKLLLPPLQATEEAVAGAGASAANRNWCEAVVTPFETLLAKRYPFKRDGVDAPLPEVEKFFQPDKGTLWKYYAESLKSDIETDGKSFRVLPNAGVKYTSKLTGFLARAQQLTDALFADAGGKIGMPVDVRIWPASTAEGGNAANLVSKIVFEIGGQKPVVYQNWKESWVRTGFPGRGAKLRVSTTKGEVEEIAREGDWGLFRLLDEAKQNRQVDTEEYLTAVWPLASTQARIRVDFRPTSLSRPFSGFDVPHNVAPGSSPCGK